jgi:hypothetical protein
VYEADLGTVSMTACAHRTPPKAGRGTYAIRKVCDQVANLSLACLELAVQPAEVRLAACHGERACGEAHHLVNVFCWTLTHCCSSGAMFAGCVHQAAKKGL